MKSNAKCRFILVHVVATNICIWILMTVSEAIEFYHEEVQKMVKGHGDQKLNVTGGGREKRSAELSEPKCGTNEMRSIAGVYLIPCIIEHSLFVIPVLHTMYYKMVNTKALTINKPTIRSCAKFWAIIKRIHIGFIVFIFALACESVYIYMHTVLHEKIEESQMLYLGAQIFLLVLVIIGLCVGFYWLSKLGFDATKPMSFDELLLFISMGGYIFYNVCRLLPSIEGIYNQHTPVETLLSVLMLVSSGGSIIHALLQSTFISIGLRSHPLTDEHSTKKPGRSVIGFLVVSNLSLWLTVTLEIRKSTMVIVYQEFYGQLPWLLLTFSAIPLVIFYLFHSTVCLSDVWKEAYEGEEVNQDAD